MPARKPITSEMEDARKQVPGGKEFNKWRFSQIEAVCRRPDVNGNAKVIYSVLVNRYLQTNARHEQRGLAWPSYSSVSILVGCSVPTVERAYRDLARAGLILVAYQGGYYRSNLVAFPAIPHQRLSHDAINQMASRRQSGAFKASKRRTISNRFKPTSTNLLGDEGRKYVEKAHRRFESALIEVASDLSSEQVFNLSDQYQRKTLTRELFLETFSDPILRLKAADAADQLHLPCGEKTDGRLSEDRKTPRGDKNIWGSTP